MGSNNLGIKYPITSINQRCIDATCHCDHMDEYTQAAKSVVDSMGKKR